MEFVAEVLDEWHVVVEDGKVKWVDHVDVGVVGEETVFPEQTDL